MNKDIVDYFNFVGISGIAGAGKDLFFTLCREYLKKHRIHSARVALGDEVKARSDKAIKDLYGFSAKTCNREQKNQIRSHLVFLGTLKRKETQGRYWIEQAEETIKSLYKNCLPQNLTHEGGTQQKPFVFITDVRYNEYKKDEVYWVRNQLKGTLVHVEKFTPHANVNCNNVPTGEFTHNSPPAPNNSEKKNDPRVQKKADFLVKWQDHKNLELKEVKKLLAPTAKSIIDKILKTKA
tara:strand:- start:375 stop:1085 length:711 start_codon:yes stop_codon:yes gene_type:complete